MADTRAPAQLTGLLRKLKLKQGYKLERTGGGHYRLRDRHGALVEYEGRPLTMTGNPSPGVENAIESQLREARALQGTQQRRRPGNPKQKKGIDQAHAERAQAVQALAQRLGELLKVVGGLDMPGMVSDLGHVGALIAREQGRTDMTPDLVMMNAYRISKGQMVETRYFEVWTALVERLDRAPDTGGEWYALVREARGLPLDQIEVRAADSEEEWPFRVELLSIRSLLADEAYQRPVNWPFVRARAAQFDPSLVGTIDVAQRSPSRYAILDGQQRTEMVRLVGLETVWASIYRGLDGASEARFFLHKNRDRRGVHPYYTFRARVAAKEEAATAMDRMVTETGYKIAIGVPADGQVANIAAIAALERAYRRQRPDGGSALPATLETLSRATLGRPAGQSAAMLGGVSLLFAQYTDEEMAREQLVAMMTALGPQLLLGRARDVKSHSGGTIDVAVSHVLTHEYDARAPRGARLPKARGRERLAA